MEKRCADCKHWYQGDVATEWGDCERMQGSEGMPVDEDTLAFAEAVEPVTRNDIVSVTTRSDFGCVMWEQKA
jgi:hypothetical protein